ncbi:MAG: glycosyltransferase family 4 protein [Flavobacteriales bacterium]|nr:glycosyltransferase family 4 protein [Flavobacteriales bacterium]
MKVLIVNSSDLEGGAARAANRLHVGLQRVGVESRMLVQSKESDDRLVQGARTPMEKAMSKLRPSLDLIPLKRYPGSQGRIFSPSWLPFSGVVKRINASDADVVHLHWVTAGMLRIEDLAGIRKPIVWSLHDMWAFTGGCHYDGECGRYTQRCGKCPVLGSDRAQDLSRKVFQRKERTYARTRLTIVGLSNWMADTARASTLLKGHRVVQLPNPIDTEVFKPVDKRMAKRLLGLPEERPLVLFGAVNATADPRKGFPHLSEALRTLPPGSVELGVFGASRPMDPPDLGHPIHYLGRLHDDTSLCVLYNAADVTVVPSLQENLSNTIVESLACGTPAVGFDIGGNRDMIDDRSNGGLARPFDPADLADRIRWVLEHPDKERLTDDTRRSAVERFEQRMVAERYRRLYTEVIARDGKD